jgi:hypothetical protein
VHNFGPQALWRPYAPRRGVRDARVRARNRVIDRADRAALSVPLRSAGTKTARIMVPALESLYCRAIKARYRCSSFPRRQQPTARILVSALPSADRALKIVSQRRGLQAASRVMAGDALSPSDGVCARRLSPSMLPYVYSPFRKFKPRRAMALSSGS